MRQREVCFPIRLLSQELQAPKFFLAFVLLKEWKKEWKNNQSHWGLGDYLLLGNNKRLHPSGSPETTQLADLSIGSLCTRCLIWKDKRYILTWLTKSRGNSQLCNSSSNCLWMGIIRDLPSICLKGPQNFRHCPPHRLAQVQFRGWNLIEETSRGRAANWVWKAWQQIWPILPEK